MVSGKSRPIAQDAYDELAESYAAMVDTKPHNAYYERPATLSLLPEVRGKRVLDAGCGPGAYAEWLAEHGSVVLAVDGNPKMVDYARQRLGDKAEVLVANLEEPLDFLTNASFDVIVCPLVMDYVRDWLSAFREFYRILKAEGCLVFSFEHPQEKFNLHSQTSNYFEVELVEYTWHGFGKPVSMPSYRRPLSEVYNPLVQAGFILDHVLEPVPTQEFREKMPEDFEKLSRNPGFMCIRALKKDYL